ncbi:hybrid sensor histidine kinase/response regulator transcription factor [Neolewinella xylanilytica]|uniref:hybrid sensor histidine kinase/response regulator transcription factor n=1 Tax=Neolewinella xylanilytica TaxID=1514080 RepID=UPI00147389C8|nr:hybrid sensor histidine kinase/response regulator transcription factor [Neolewinella xylanilytica]
MLKATQPYTPTVVNPLTESWRWRQFPELSDKGIRCIVETPDRRVFAGSTDGVLEYNGYDWTAHTGRNSPQGYPVEQLLVASDGSIVASNRAGIFRYREGKWTHEFVAPDNFPFSFTALKELNEGSILGCSDRGFLRLAGGKVSILTSATRQESLKNALPEVTWFLLPDGALSESRSFHSASDVLEDARGDVWLALNTTMESGKLLRFHPADFFAGGGLPYEVVQSAAGTKLGSDQKVLEAKDGRIWVINSSSDRGIVVYDGREWETISVHPLFGGDEYMTDIVQSDNGIIWISTIAKIYSYSPNGAWELYKAPQYPIPANRVLLQKSQSDQLWLAGYKSKLLLLDFSLSRWLTYDGLSFQFADGPDEEWFVEADNRVVRRSGDEWIAYGTEDGLMDAPVRLLRTSAGQLWAAGSHLGKAATAVLRGEKWELHLHPTLSWGIDYRAVFEASDGGLWFGGSVDARSQDGFTSGVLELRDPTAETFEWVHHVYGENGLNQANVYGIGETPDGTICIGGSKLMLFEGGSWRPAEDERLQQYVNCLRSTEDLLLVGSRYYGVFVYDGQEWKNYTTDDGLSGNTILSIDALSDSLFIVATENGTCAFDGQSWTCDLFPDQLALDFEGGTITHTDDYLWIDHVPRSWKRRALTGSTFEQEPNTFFSTRYQPSRTPPETSIAFYTERVPAEGNGIISWAGKDFFGKTNAENLVFSYRLDGGPWLPYGSDNEYAFTSMPDGPHRLEVRARDIDFNVDPTPAVVDFAVLPPIWKQGWFIGLMLLFLAIFGFYEYRVLTKKKKLEVVNASLHERNEEIRHQRDKLESMLVQLENLSKAKLGFFTNISHELRTPLTLILGPITQLVEEQESLSETRRRQLQSMVQRNANRLLKLIDQLLEIRRIEHTSLEINLSDIHLARYVEAIVELFEDLALDRDVCLRMTDRTEARYASTDLDKVEKILANLLSNAFRHTPEGGTIDVTLSEEAAEAADLNPFYDRYFKLEVRDTGTGISPEKIALIFDKYYTSGTGVTPSGGTGIGLSYIKDLVYLMQGEIRVDSTDGMGSTFTVYLPLIIAHPAGAGEGALRLPALAATIREASLLQDSFVALSEPPEEAAAATPRKNILVVEDNPDMLQFLAQLLRDKYRVSTATNGREGLQLAEQRSFDLIVSDVMMAEMDGMELCRQIKGKLATSHIPVVLLTAKVLDENKLSGYRMGADDYITKPFNPDLLLVRVESLLDQRQRLREKFNLDFRLTPEVEELPSADEEFMSRLVTLLQEKVSESEFNVKAMCDAMHLSHMHFIRKVKQLTGKKPIDLLKSYRMKRAKELLGQGSLTIAEVAYQVGFDLPNSFSRTFKKEFNMTPTEYAKSMQAEEQV